MKRYCHTTPRPARRGGFTLIELLMVIGIIAVLIALLFPAIGAVRERFRIAEVRQEITQLESAIADFKLKFGHEPPSSITIYEQWDDGSGNGWVGDSAARAKIRKLWPKFNFKMTRNINGDGDNTDVYTLKGDQCLVFFLGGAYINGGTDSAQFVGFSGNPTDPFQLPAGTGPSTTRIGPFFEFQMGRVIDGGAVSYPSASLVRFPVYRDPYPGQSKPYLYATSYDGLGYNDSASVSDVATPASGNFRIYLTDTKAAAGDPDPPAWKPNGYQIISPGPDGQYGIGGPFKPDATIVLPARVQSGGNDAVDPNRHPERDNITNFADGQLDS